MVGVIPVSGHAVVELHAWWGSVTQDEKPDFICCSDVHGSRQIDWVRSFHHIDSLTVLSRLAYIGFSHVSCVHSIRVQSYVMPFLLFFHLWWATVAVQLLRDSSVCLCVCRFTRSVHARALHGCRMGG